MRVRDALGAIFPSFLCSCGWRISVPPSLFMVALSLLTQCMRVSVLGAWLSAEVSSNFSLLLWPRLCLLSPGMLVDILWMIDDWCKVSSRVHSFAICLYSSSIVIGKKDILSFTWLRYISYISGLHPQFLHHRSWITAPKTLGISWALRVMTASFLIIFDLLFSVLDIVSEP